MNKMKLVCRGDAMSVTLERPVKQQPFSIKTQERDKDNPAFTVEESQKIKQAIARTRAGKGVVFTAEEWDAIEEANLDASDV
jgi:hypothetical protein